MKRKQGGNKGRYMKEMRGEFLSSHLEKSILQRPQQAPTLTQ